MKTNLSFCLLALCLTHTANAAYFDLLQRADVDTGFETPEFMTTWSAVDETQLPGWESAGTRIELWSEGVHYSPATGSDGEPTGQHMEIVYSDPLHAVRTDSLTVPAGLESAYATLRFDYWYRAKYNSFKVSVISESTGLTAFTQTYYNPLSSRGSVWEAAEATNVPVIEGDTYYIEFAYVSGPNISAHIDDVEFLVDIAPVIVEGDLHVKGIGRIDGGLDLIGNGISIYADEASYESGGAPSVVIHPDGSIIPTQPGGDLSMGDFTGE